MGLSTRLKLLLVISLAILLPLLVLAVIWTHDLHLRARASLEQDQANLAELVGNQVGTTVGDIQYVLETAANVPALRDGRREEVEAILDRIAAAGGRVGGRQLLVVRRDGAVVAARGGTTTPGSVANLIGFRRAVEGRAFAVGEPDPQSPLGPGVLDFWQPVVDSSGAIVRLVGLAIDGRFFAGAWERLRLGGSAVLLLSQSGRVVAVTPAAAGGVGRDLSRLPLREEMRQRGTGSGQGLLIPDGVPRVYGYRRIAGASWQVAVGVPPELAEARASLTLSGKAYAALALLVLVLAGVAWAFAQNLTGPIRGIAAAVQRLAVGDLRAPVRGGGPPDVHAIAADLERIRQQMAEQQAALRRLEAGRGDSGGARRGEARGRQPGLALVQALAAAAANPAGEERVAATERFLSEVLTLLGMDAAALYEVEEPRRALHLVAQVGYDPGAAGMFTALPLGEGLAGRAAASGQVILVEDVVSDPRLGTDAARLAGFHGLAALPLLSAGRTLGAVEVVSRSRRKLAGQELRLLTAVVEPIAVALASGAIVRQAEQRSSRLEALARLTQSIASSLSTQEVLYLSVLAAAQVLDPAYARVWVWDAGAGGLRPGPWHGRAELAGEGAAGEAAAGARAPTRDPESEARMATLAARGGDPVFIQELASDWRCPEPDWWVSRGAVSFAALPLRAGDRVLGVLTVVPRGASSFPGEERDLLTGLAGHVAIALENARLYQERAAAAQAAASPQVEAAAFETKVGRIVASIGRAPNLQRAAEALAAGASDALGLGAVWAAVMDGSGALCLCREGTAVPRPVPPLEENGLPSLVARAMAERTIQAWSGATPCWEAREGLVARRGSAAVPILAGGEQGPAAAPGAVLGALLLPDPDGSGWPPDLLARVERLGREAAPLLARARDLEAAQSSREQLAEALYFSVLKELAQIAGTSPALTSLVEAVASRLRLLPGCDGVSVGFEDPYDGRVWYAREPWAMGEAAVPFWVPGVETSAQLAIGLHEPVLIPDLQDSLLPLHRRWAEAGLRSLVEVPVVTGGRSGGLLVVASRTPSAFPPEQVAFFTSVTAAVGGALAKARRLAEAEGAL